MVAVEPPVRTVESPLSPRSGSPRSEDSDRDVKDQENKDSTPKKRKTLFRWTQRISLTPGSPLEVRPDDGFSWRKYGQKEILGARYPRGYYRCTHRNGQGCLATKQVQRSDEDPMIFEVTYCGTHTCTQAASSSQVPPSLSSDSSQTLYQQTNQQQQEQRNRLLQEAEEVKRRNEFLEREIVLANQKVQSLSGCQVVDDDRSTVASDLSIEGLTDDKAANLHAAKIIEEENTRLREENGVLKHKSEFLERQITILNQKLQRALDHKENEDNASTIDLDYQDQDAESVGVHGTEWKEALMQEGDEHDQLPCALRKLEQQLGLSDVELEAHSSVLDQLPDEKKMSKQIVKLEEATNEVGPLASQSIYLFGNHILSGVRLADAKKPVDDLSEENFHCPPPEFPSDLKTYLLRELDFSHTNINFLPEALPALVSLQKLILKRCQLLMELPPQVGQLPNLEMLDLDETEVFDLPQEIGRLFKLKFLRVSFYGYMNRGKKLSQNALIHPKTISTLSQLAELSIDVNPDDERWYDVVGYVIEETCSLEKLRSLTLYVPDVEILKKRKPGNTSLNCYPLHQFKLTVGQHIQRFMSPIPKEVEAQFQAWDKCVKFVKGKSIPNEIKKVLEYANAFYLERHASATSLSDFGIENLWMLEFCLLEECDKIETILDGGKSSEVSALLNLQYLHIYLLENLVTIWRNPDNDQSLSRLKFLALHECQELSEVFSVRFLANLTELEVLIVEDCPQVTSIVSLPNDVLEFNYSVGDTHFLPNLKTLVLIWLPNLVSISIRLSIAANLEKIGVYNCPELESLSAKELSSDSLKVVKGEEKWWEALKWDESEWDSIRIGYLQSKFIPIQREKDVMSQMQEMWESPSREQSN